MPILLIINPIKYLFLKSWKVWGFIFLPVFCILYSSSLLTFLKGIDSKPKSIYFPPYDFIEKSYIMLEPYHLTNSYGLFRRMTGVGGRPELIIYGSMDGKTWQEYILPYKPQDLSRAPRFNIPHQPRLDWQMWFAALTDINNSYWFFTMINRLFSGSPGVLSLFEHVPMNKPKYLKVEQYLYNFTHTGDDWWTRKYVRDWVPPITSDKNLVEQWKKFGFPDPRNYKNKELHPFHFVPVLEIIAACLILRILSQVRFKRN